MGERKSNEYLNKLKEKYNTSIIWSWSRYNSYCTDPYGYMLHYIKHEQETRHNIYGISGGNIHQIIQDLYTKDINFEDMLPAYEDKLFEMNCAELKYDRNDAENNKNIATKYEDNIRLFMQHHQIIPYKTITEQFLLIQIDKYIFQGYADMIYKDNDGVYHIVDWKSSTIYVGKKIDKEKFQLVLYAESLIQKGVPIDKIKIKWAFLKYCTITYTLKAIDKETKQHKIKTKNSLRTEYVKSIESNLRVWLTTMEYDELEIEDMVQTCIENNNLDTLPKELQNKYTMSDCYVDIPLEQEVIDELKINIKNTLDEIMNKTNEYNETKNDELFWTTIDKSNEYFFACLCGYSRKIHKPYDEYLNDNNKFANGDKNKEDDSMDWLRDL